MRKTSIALLFCLGAANGFAQCSTNRISVRKESHLSSAVIVARVTAATPVPEAWDFLDGIDYTVQVESKTHGHERKAEMTIFSENIPNNFEMYVGQRYVLYLQPKWGRYQVDGCGNSHATDELELAKQTKPIATRGF